MGMTTRAIVRSGMIAAAYWLTTASLAPISYGPVQLRLSGLLYPLALFAPEYAMGFGLGVFLANLNSPFGLLDMAVMPLATAAACVLAHRLRRWPVMALTFHAAITAICVSVFPLGIGAGLPVIVTLPGVLASQLLVIFAGWLIIWRNRTKISMLFSAPERGHAE